MSAEPYIAVLGAVNVDIIGTPDSKMIMGDSNPGTVTITLGGVARNIAENLVRLSCSVKFITLLGEDNYAEHIRQNCRELGIDISDSFVIKGARSSTYLCVNSVHGDAVAAVADMGIYDAMTPELIQAKMPVLNSAALVVMDTNLPAQTIDFITHNVTAPIMCDPVSTKKASKMAASLNRFSIIKPSLIEAEELLGRTIHSDKDLVEAGRAFIQMGIKEVFISLGSSGVFYYDGVEGGKLPCYPTMVHNTTGCGDAFGAAASIGFITGQAIQEQARMGLAAASICAESYETVSSQMSLECLKRIMEGNK